MPVSFPVITLFEEVSFRETTPYTHGFSFIKYLFCTRISSWIIKGTGGILYPVFKLTINS